MKLVLGGARSGKSRFAQSLCREREDVTVVVTARIDEDSEMAARIERHRRERPSSWQTNEAPLEVVAAIAAQPSDRTVLVDCATVWLSNLMLELKDLEREERERSILEKASALASASREREVIVVSNEVGGGVVPGTPVGREFRDLQGLFNQALAREAERVWLVVAGRSIELPR
jgi:adenosylcobinamide kinase/adenosylcobinamide-phosphate guanylyltransferase